MAGQGPGNKIDKCLAEHSAGAVVIWMVLGRCTMQIGCVVCKSCMVASGSYPIVREADLLSPAADVSSSFTSLEEHCGENST